MLLEAVLDKPRSWLLAHDTDLLPHAAAQAFNAAAARYHEHASWHHALHDAQAHRHGWMAVQDHIKEPSCAHLHDHPTA